jgi:hypothetical protein
MAVLDRVPVDRITVEARDIQVGRTVVTLLAALLYVIGWVAAKLFTAVWFAVAWSAVAVKVGWKEGRASSSMVRKGG